MESLLIISLWTHPSILLARPVKCKKQKNENNESDDINFKWKYSGLLILRLPILYTPLAY